MVTQPGRAQAPVGLVLKLRRSDGHDLESSLHQVDWPVPTMHPNSFEPFTGHFRQIAHSKVVTILVP